MKVFFVLTAFATVSLFSFRLAAQPNKPAVEHLYIDIHHMGAGKVTADAVAEAHAKDLAVEGKYDVHFLKYWVDEASGTVYCLSSSPDTTAIRKTHAEAHGLLPDQIYMVTDGPEASLISGNNFYLDIHELGAGKITAKELAAGAHKEP